MRVILIISFDHNIHNIIFSGNSYSSKIELRIYLLRRLDGEVGDADVVWSALLLDGDGVGGHRLELPQHRHQLAPQSTGGGGGGSHAGPGQRVAHLKQGLLF